jgi:TolA-binding protein
MRTVIPVAKRLAVCVVAVGALSLGWTGLAGAASTTSPTVNAPASTSVSSSVKCARATKVVTRIEKAQARVEARLPKVTAAEAKAQQAGRTKRVARLQKRLARLEKRVAHMKSAEVTAHLQKIKSAIAAKCSAPAPGAPASTTTTPSTTAAPGSTTTTTQA